MILAVLAAAALMVQPPTIRLDMPPNDGPACDCGPPPFVRIYSNSVLKFQGAAVPLSKLPEVLALRTEGGINERIFLVVDDATPYGTVEAVIAALRDAGFRKIGLVPDFEGDRP